MTRRRLHSDQGGFTLVEAMIACVLLVVITGTSQLVLQGAFGRNESLQRRSDALQRGRIAQDRIQTLLRSSVCLTTVLPPVGAATANSFTVYADTTEATSATVPTKHIVSVASNGDLTDAIYPPAGTVDANGVPQYASTPARTLLVAQGIRGVAGTPIFQFYGYPANTVPAEPTEALNSAASPTVTGTANLARIGKVTTTFQAFAGNLRPSEAQASLVTSDAFIRATNPNFAAPKSTAPGAICS